MLPLFTWVAIDVVLWGFITKYLNSVTESGLNFVPTLLGRGVAVGLFHPRNARDDDGLL